MLIQHASLLNLRNQNAFNLINNKSQNKELVNLEKFKRDLYKKSSKVLLIKTSLSV